MKVLAIETSGLVASVAVADEEKTICEFTTNNKKTHSVTLMPMIDALFNIIDLEIKDMDLIAVSAGPGSFTGLRIGSATAKGIAMALNIPIASVPTLEAMAYNIEKTDLLICPMMDARRHQVYSALYAYEGELLKPLTEMMIIDIEEYLQLILQYSKGVIFLGDGFESNAQRIQDALSELEWHVAKPQNKVQKASSVAMLGLQYAKAGKLETHLEHTPIYLRKTQAEREYEEKSH